MTEDEDRHPARYALEVECIRKAQDKLEDAREKLGLLGMFASREIQGVLEGIADLIGEAREQIEFPDF